MRRAEIQCHFEKMAKSGVCYGGACTKIGHFHAVGRTLKPIFVQIDAITAIGFLAMTGQDPVHKEA